MPQTKAIQMNVPASVAAGTAVSIEDMQVGTLFVQVSGTFVATLQMQVSADGVVWTTMGSNITAPIVQQVSAYCRLCRVNTSAFTSGTPAATLVFKAEQQAF